jgi:hypothetical protein
MGAEKSGDLIAGVQLSMFVNLPRNVSQLDGLDGFFSSFKRSLRPGNIVRQIKKVDPIGAKILAQVNRDPVTQALNKVSTQSLKTLQRTDTAIKKGVATSKIAQGVIYAAGAVFAPFTGGASLALAAAAIQSSKASAAGRSFGAQLIQGVGAGAIGYVAGVGLVYGAGAAGIGPAATAGQASSFLTPFGTAAASIAPGAASALGPYAGGAALTSGVSAPAAVAATGGSFLGTYGQTALVGLALANAVKGGNKTGAADILATSAGLDPNAIALMNQGLPQGWSSGTAPSGDGGGGGGGGPVPAPQDATTAQVQTSGFDFTPYLPWLAAGLGGVLLFSMLSRQPRVKKLFRRRSF